MCGNESQIQGVSEGPEKTLHALEKGKAPMCHAMPRFDLFVV